MSHNHVAHGVGVDHVNLVNHVHLLDHVHLVDHVHLLDQVNLVLGNLCLSNLASAALVKAISIVHHG